MVCWRYFHSRTTATVRKARSEMKLMLPRIFHPAIDLLIYGPIRPILEKRLFRTSRPAYRGNARRPRTVDCRTTLAKYPRHGGHLSRPCRHDGKALSHFPELGNDRNFGVG